MLSLELQSEYCTENIEMMMDSSLFIIDLFLINGSFLHHEAKISQVSSIIFFSDQAVSSSNGLEILFAALLPFDIVEKIQENRGRCY